MTLLAPKKLMSRQHDFLWLLLIPYGAKRRPKHGESSLAVMRYDHPSVVIDYYAGFETVFGTIPLRSDRTPAGRTYRTCRMTSQSRYHSSMTQPVAHSIVLHLSFR